MRDTLDNLCMLIPGDAQQFSLFRRQAAPVECPFRGSFTFTYSRGHGECRSPGARLDSCTESSRIFFRYQACPDVQGTESSGLLTFIIIYHLFNIYSLFILYFIFIHYLSFILYLFINFIDIHIHLSTLIIYLIIY